MGSSALQVSRISEKDLKIRSIELLVDGRHVGDLTFGDSVEIPVEPGSHILTATNRLKSASSEFQVAEGETVRFEAVGFHLRGIWLLMAVLGTVPYGIRLERLGESPG